MLLITSYYSESEIEKLGLKKYGQNVKISRKASIYGPENISIGNNVRIDDFCIISGNVTLGSYIHIAAYCGLFGKSGIIMKDFSGLSSRVSIYSVSDDYLGNALANATIPDEFRKVDSGKVILEKHVIVGAGTVILPKTRIGVGSAIGALSLVKGPIPPWGVYSGIPAKFRKERKSSIIKQHEKELIEKYPLERCS